MLLARGLRAPTCWKFRVACPLVRLHAPLEAGLEGVPTAEPCACDPALARSLVVEWCSAS